MKFMKFFNAVVIVIMLLICQIVTSETDFETFLHDCNYNCDEALTFCYNDNNYESNKLIYSCHAEHLACKHDCSKTFDRDENKAYPDTLFKRFFTWVGSF